MAVDMTGILRRRLTRAVVTARRRHEAGDVELAAWYYRCAADHLTNLSESVCSARLRREYRTQAASLQQMARQVREPASCSDSAQRVGDAGDDEFTDRIRQLIVRSMVSWNDVVGMDEIQKAVKETYVLALASQRDEASGLPGANLLLYGPSGTGKTLLASAVSNGIDATFFCVSAGDLLSKWFGDSSRLIAALFAEARRKQPSVIFIDDFEVLVPDRSSDVSGPEARVLSQILVEMDGLRAKRNGAFVMTIAATNAPWRIDHAVLSRFGRVVHVPLPDAKARAAIFDLHLRRKGYCSAATPEWLADRTHGYSGREIAQICADMIRRMTARANPGLADAADQGRASAASYRVRRDTVTTDDFQAAISNVRKACSEEAERRYHDWAMTAA